MHIVKTFPKNTCIITSENFEIKLDASLKPLKLLKKSDYIAHKNTDIFTNNKSLSTERKSHQNIGRLKKRIDSSLDNHTIIGKQISPISIKSKKFSIGKGLKNIEKEIQKEDSNILDVNIFNNVIFNTGGKMNSDSSAEEMLPWDYLNCSLTPIYKIQANVKSNKSNLRLPKLSRPKSFISNMK